MRRISFVLVCLLAPVLLGSSGPATAQSDPDPGYATRPYAPQNFQLPEGTGCAGEVARWQAIQDNDYQSGNIGLPVYHRIQAEIAQAATACAAGQEAKASGMIRASRARHGYPQ